MKTVSATISTMAWPPTSSMRLQGGLHADRGNGDQQHPAGQVAERLADELRDGTPKELIGGQRQEGQDEAGDERRTLALAFLGLTEGTDDQREDQHHRGQHCHADQLDQGRRLAGFLGDREAGADDLGHVVDRAAQEDAGLDSVERTKTCVMKG